jgi:prevent-host-death family protein
MTYSVKEARNKLPQILKSVEDGEEVTITRNGKPVAELVPARTRKKPRFGTMKHLSLIADPNWNRPQNDIDAWLRGDV